MGNNPKLQQYLKKLGLNNDESKIFTCLLGGPKTQLEISRYTNIARSNVYRIVDGLIDKSLIHETTTDEGKLLETVHPDSLELLVIQAEDDAKNRRDVFEQFMGLFSNLNSQEGDFAIKTYSGIAGIKQMLWNELKTKGEVRIFSSGSQDNTVGKRWAEKFRSECIKKGLRQRAIENKSNVITQSDLEEFNKHYVLRFIDEKTLSIKPEITIHDDTVSVYNYWRSDIRIGTEIKNPMLTTFMEQVFDHYWELSTPGQVEKYS